MLPPSLIKVQIQTRLFKVTQRTITISQDGIVWTKVVMQNVDEMNDDRSTEKHCGSLVVLLLYGVNTENVANGVNAGRVKRDGMPIKSLLSKITFLTKVRVVSSKKYL